MSKHFILTKLHKSALFTTMRKLRLFMVLCYYFWNVHLVIWTIQKTFWFGSFGILCKLWLQFRREKQSSGFFLRSIRYDKIYLLHRQLNYKRHLKIFSEFKHSFYGIILLVRLLTLPFSLWQCSIKQHRIENISSGIRDLFWNHLYFEWKVIVHEMAKQMLTPKMKTEKYGQQTFVCFFHLF